MDIFGLFGKLFNDIISYPLGAILHVCYTVTGNYAISLILFTVITRFCLFPLAIKQQKSSAEMLRMKPKLDKIQKKYAKDKVKLQEEMAKLYQEEGYNPMAGCMPMAIQLPILYGLFNVVYNPLSYIYFYSQNLIDKIASAIRPEIFAASGNTIKNLSDPKIQLYMAKAMKGHMDKLSFLGNIKTIDFNLFGFDLSAVPKLGWNILILIPILCYVTSAFSTWLSMRMNKAIQGPMNNGANNIFMTLAMPLMSAWFATVVPAAVGFYWIITNLFMILQVILLNRFFSMERLAEKAEIEAEKRREAIRNGTYKPSRFAKLQQAALDASKQAMNQQNGVSGAQAKQEVKLNSKGKKSRSQIKEEQRRRLAQSRNNSNKK